MRKSFLPKAAILSCLGSIILSYASASAFIATGINGPIGSGFPEAKRHGGIATGPNGSFDSESSYRPARKKISPDLKNLTQKLSSRNEFSETGERESAFRAEKKLAFPASGDRHLRQKDDRFFERMALSVKRLAKHEKAISASEKAYNVDHKLIKAISAVESGGNERTKDSPKGAIGIMQLMPRTARELGANPRDPRQSFLAGTRYLVQQYQEFGTLEKALVAYNQGPGRAKEYLKRKRAKDDPYVHEVKAAYEFIAFGYKG